MDLELIIPIEHQPHMSEDGFSFRREFVLENAIVMRVPDGSQRLQTAMQQMMEYVKGHRLQPTSNAYFVTSKINVSSAINGGIPCGSVGSGVRTTFLCKLHKFRSVTAV